MTGPRRLALATGLWWSALPALAAASDLSWSGPPDCRQSDQLLFQVERALGTPLAETGSVHLQVHIDRVVPDARALLRIARGTAGATTGVKERLLVAPDCSTLVDTLAVAITLAVEAAVPADTPSEIPVGNPLPTLSTAQATPVNPPLALRDVASGSAPQTSALALVPSVSALLVGDSGSLPGGALGMGFGAQLGGPHWHLQLLGTLWLDQHPRLAASSVAGAGADVHLATGALIGCTNPFGSAGDALSLSLCAGWEMGRFWGSGAGVNHPRSASVLWLAPGLQAGAAWAVPGSRLSLEARLGAVMPLERNEFVLEGLGTVHQPASLAARASLGIAVALE